MDALTESTLTMEAAEQIPATVVATRLSSAIFFLLCVVPAFVTMLFGGVDSATWVLISMFWALLVLLWLADSWNSGGVTINTSWLQAPIVGLIAIGAIQLLPLGGDPGGSLGAAASRTI